MSEIETERGSVGEVGTAAATYSCSMHLQNVVAGAKETAVAAAAADGDVAGAEEDAGLT